MSRLVKLNYILAGRKFTRNYFNNNNYCYLMSYRRRFATVGYNVYMNGPALPSFYDHVLRSLGQFPLAQSTSEYCQSKIFSAFHDFVSSTRPAIKLPSYN